VTDPSIRWAVQLPGDADVDMLDFDTDERAARRFAADTGFPLMTRRRWLDEDGTERHGSWQKG
jgi:hypothetical protein